MAESIVFETRLTTGVKEVEGFKLNEFFAAYRCRVDSWSTVHLPSGYGIWNVDSLPHAQWLADELASCAIGDLNFTNPDDTDKVWNKSDIDGIQVASCLKMGTEQGDEN